MPLSRTLNLGEKKLRSGIALTSAYRYTQVQNFFFTCFDLAYQQSPTYSISVRSSSVSQLLQLNGYNFEYLIGDALIYLYVLNAYALSNICSDHWCSIRREISKSGKFIHSINNRIGGVSFSINSSILDQTQILNNVLNFWDAMKKKIFISSTALLNFF